MIVYCSAEVHQSYSYAYINTGGLGVPCHIPADVKNQQAYTGPIALGPCLSRYSVRAYDSSGSVYSTI